MAERKRSKDGKRETEEILGERGEIDHGGRQGGAPARNVSTIDEEKRSRERPAGATRVTKSRERKGS